ncbi:MAG: TIGR03560 family F420-dependent LLM class oxidoreductase [Thermoproteota archaeon]
MLNEVPQMSTSPNYPELEALCRRCEDIGFDSAWLMDHLTWGPNDAVLECWTTLSSLSRATSKIHLGPFFLCNSYRNPSLVAKMAATLDVISEGRLELGIGAGWKEDEYKAYGYPFRRPKERIAQLDEAASIIKLMWSGKQATYRGRYYTILNAVCKPMPVQPGGPRLWIGGGGEKLTLRVTAKHADACNFSGLSTSLETFRRKMEVLEYHCQAVGRNSSDIVKSVTLELILGKDEAEARQKERNAPFSRSPETRFVGNPSKCLSFLQNYIDAGASYFMLHIEDLLPGIEIFEKEVLPSFR